MSVATGIKGTLSLGKGLKKKIDDVYERYIKAGGKKTKKAFTAEELSKKKQLDKAKQNRQIKQQKSKKDYEKTLPDTLKKKGTALVSLNKNIKDIAKKSLKDKKKGTALIKKPTSEITKKPGTALIKKTTSEVTKKPGTNLVISNKSRSLVNIPKGGAGAKQTSKNILNKQKQSFLKRNKGKIAAAVTVLGLTPTLIKTDDSKVGAEENKKITPSKDKGPDTSKITKPSSTVKVKKQALSQTKADDYTGRFIDKEGNVAYDSFSDFLAHMTGKPKKRAMPKKTARIIGTGNKLKRKEADTKGAGKGVKFQAFKAGTKDKTVGLKDLPPKSKNPGIHKLPAKTKIDMGFKPMFSGGFISSLYDKPEKAEKYKGNTSAGRQVKGYGKARKRP